MFRAERGRCWALANTFFRSAGGMGRMAQARKQETALGRLLAAAPVAVYALDDQRRLLYGNAALGGLLGVDIESLRGQRCDYRTAASDRVAVADVAASLSPPAEVWSGLAVVAELQLLHQNGQLIRRPVSFYPLGADTVQCVGVLALVGAAGPRDQVHSETLELHGQLWQLQRQALLSGELESLVGCSAAIQRMRELVGVAAQGCLRVVVHGPSGSGREHVARYLHRGGRGTAYGPLVRLACPLMDAELLQSTVASFLREAEQMKMPAGAADQSRPPALLLLEVDQLSAEAQAELAGFLSLPGLQLYTIGTAQCDLIALSRAGRYRSDLAHLLSTLTIELPPLADRREDIALLSQYFLEKYNAQGGRQLTGFTAEALDELAGFLWPENVDQLSEVVEVACRCATGTVVDVEDLPGEFRAATSADAHPRRVDEPIDLEAFLESIEKQVILRALRQSKGNKTQAARLLGVNRARLHRRLEYFSLE